MGFFQKVRAVWQKISVVQRALLVAMVLSFVAAGWLLVRWAGRPDMRMLYQDLSPEEASLITEKIAEKQIEYELRGGGTSIYVPREGVYQLRLDMAREGLPTGAQGGYKILDDEKIGISPFVQNVNLQRALQDELAKSIQMMDGVSHCRVHIVSGKQSIFASEQSGTSASIVLRLRPGFQVSALNIAAITHLVAGSVEGLRPEGVTVVDSKGRLLSSESDEPVAAGAGTVQDYKERVEKNLSDKVEKMLTAVLGEGRAVVRVSAVIDMTRINLVTEKYDPTGKVTAKEEITTNSETGSSTVAGEGEGGQVLPGSVKKDEVTVTEYMVGKSVEQRTELPGQVKSLSVAAFVDLRPADANSATGGSEAKIMAVADVERIIRNALGLTDADSVEVVEVEIQTAGPELIAEAKSGGGLNIIAIARHLSLGIMAICALFALKIFSGAKKKAAAAELEAAQARGTAAGLLPGASEGAEPVVIRRQIANALRNNPEQVKQLFTSWIREGE